MEMRKARPTEWVLFWLLGASHIPVRLTATYDDAIDRRGGAAYTFWLKVKMFFRTGRWRTPRAVTRLSAYGSEPPIIKRMIG